MTAQREPAESLKSTNGLIHEYPASTAEEFWEYISPQRYLFRPQSKPIFRGQRCETWHLEPSILRKKWHPVYSSVVFRSSPDISECRIFTEIAALDRFARYCDSSGLHIPGDSDEFRRKYLDPTKVMDDFISNRRTWPSEEYFQIMALAQHHGLPTRLLDWTERSYVAAYFAASGALTAGTSVSGRLAVWAFNNEDIRTTSIRVIPVPGNNSANIAAQSGLFTLLTQEYTRGEPFGGPQCLDEYVVSCGSNELAKITLPVCEAPKIIDLCERYGVTAATVYPDFYGAAKATLDWLACGARSGWTDGRDIRAQTLPVPRAVSR